MIDIAFVLVHYHSADLLRRAVGAILADLDACGISAEILVVDNGSDEAEREVLRELPIRCLSPGTNTGYAAALNVGTRNTRASVLLLMNPDVLVLPGCIVTLVQALREGASVAGPRFYWDIKKRFLMPPTEQRTIAAELWGATAEWSAGSARRARRRWRLHARRHWCATQPIATACLSGAMMAVRRDALEKIGPFDEEFRLYFEEQDWLTRLIAKGLRTLYVPAAEAIHLFNQSAVREPRAANWEAASWSRFAAKHHPVWLPAAVRVLRSRRSWQSHMPPDASGCPPRLDLSEFSQGADRPSWIEVSPLLRGFPAGATFLPDGQEPDWKFPSEIWEYLAPGKYFLTVGSANGAELSRAVFDRPT